MTIFLVLLLIILFIGTVILTFANPSVILGTKLTPQKTVRYSDSEWLGTSAIIFLIMLFIGILRGFVHAEEKVALKAINTQITVFDTLRKTDSTDYVVMKDIKGLEQKTAQLEKSLKEYTQEIIELKVQKAEIGEVEFLSPLEVTLFVLICLLLPIYNLLMYLGFLLVTLWWEDCAVLELFPFYPYWEVKDRIAAYPYSGADDTDDYFLVSMRKKSVFLSEKPDLRNPIEFTASAIQENITFDSDRKAAVLAKMESEDHYIQTIKQFAKL